MVARVQTGRIQLDVFRPWVQEQVEKVLGFEDEVVYNFVMSLLEQNDEAEKKELVSNLKGFLSDGTKEFVEKLWAMLVDAEGNAREVVNADALLEAKKAEYLRQAREAAGAAEERDQTSGRTNGVSTSHVESKERSRSPRISKSPRRERSETSSRNSEDNNSSSSRSRSHSPERRAKADGRYPRKRSRSSSRNPSASSDDSASDHRRGEHPARRPYDHDKRPHRTRRRSLSPSPVPRRPPYGRGRRRSRSFSPRGRRGRGSAVWRSPGRRFRGRSRSPPRRQLSSRSQSPRRPRADRGPSRLDRRRSPGARGRNRRNSRKEAESTDGSEDAQRERKNGGRRRLKAQAKEDAKHASAQEHEHSAQRVKSKSKEQILAQKNGRADRGHDLRDLIRRSRGNGATGETSGRLDRTERKQGTHAALDAANGASMDEQARADSTENRNLTEKKMSVADTREQLLNQLERVQRAKELRAKALGTLLSNEGRAALEADEGDRKNDTRAPTAHAPHSEEQDATRHQSESKL